MTSQFHPRKKPKPADPEKWEHHPNDSWIFISKAIDTYGLDPYEFRVLANVARRAGQGTCTASQTTIAEACGINKRKVMKVLNVLCAVGILKKTRTGRANHYKLRDSSKWRNPSELEAARSQNK